MCLPVGSVRRGAGHVPATAECRRTVNVVFDTILRHVAAPLMHRVGSTTARRATPITITIVGAVLGVFAAVCIALDYFAVGFVLLLAAVFCDVLDGAVARADSRVSQRGAFVDSSLDRVVDTAVLFGLTWASADTRIGLLAGLAALTGTTLPAYVSARAALAGADPEMTWWQNLGGRGERTTLILFALLFPTLTTPVLLVMASLSFWTAAHRFTASCAVLETAPQRPVVVARRQRRVQQRELRVERRAAAARARSERRRQRRSAERMWRNRRK